VLAVRTTSPGRDIGFSFSVPAYLDAETAGHHPHVHADVCFLAGLSPLCADAPRSVSAVRSPSGRVFGRGPDANTRHPPKSLFADGARRRQLVGNVNTMAYGTAAVPAARVQPSVAAIGLALRTMTVPARVRRWRDSRAGHSLMWRPEAPRWARDDGGQESSGAAT